jgi:hypothetical protein
MKSVQFRHPIKFLSPHFVDDAPRTVQFESTIRRTRLCRRAHWLPLPFHSLQYLLTFKKPTYSCKISNWSLLTCQFIYADN